MTTPAILAEGWGWRHAGRRAFAMRGLELRVEHGERVLLLGASGSGKSTLLAGIAGVLGGDEDGQAEGRLLVDGRDAAAARGVAGLVLQDPDAQIVMARAGDDTAFGPENLGVPREEIWRRVTEAQRAVGLRLNRDHPSEQLSGGQKQRLALAGVLAMRPRVLLLDEPTANLDPEGAVEVRDAVRSVLDAERATAVIVEHRVELWWDAVDRVVVVDADGVVADGSPAEVLARHGAALAARGVWVPGHAPVLRGGQPLIEVSGAELTDGVPAAGAEALVRGRGLSVARRRGHPVASDLGLDLRAGEALALTGPNGAGKSTLALTLAGLLPVEAGELTATPALANGASPTPARWRSRELLTRIGTVFQNPEHQFLASTVRDELAIGPRALRLGRAEVDARVDRLLDRLGLASLGGASPFSLSGGQKRRLSVGTALATAPRMLVLDEPTFGQDAIGWAALVELLREIAAEGRAVVAVTHDRRLIHALGAAELALGDRSAALATDRRAGG